MPTELALHTGHAINVTEPVTAALDILDAAERWATFTLYSSDGDGWDGREVHVRPSAVLTVARVEDDD